ncbi:uncharacterized protein LOC115620459 [Scaptodrosophila lebanonensis]|uniref:Uncharacterized protein LOC115620459 n=1 Tax=Drosophila lebanonensis TaxID=7225 RepID=A0A6J2T2U4_DROLE|nr:uncharacterized protein LOC115620459 [Scaptodrosophila lebanonensis]
MFRIFVTITCAVLWEASSSQAVTPTVQVAKQWKLLSYDFQPEAPIRDPNFFNPQNVLITGLAVTEDRIFVATPKLFSGVPSTVTWVSKAQFGDSPVLQAYPDWSFSNTARTDFNCSDLILTSVYRLRIDSCNRLWLLDAGISRSLEDYERTCAPKILVVDLNTDRVVRRVDFPAEVLRGESLFTNMVIDETSAKHCDDVFVYISDTVEPGIVVYDSGKDVTWRVSHPAMYPDPDFAQSEILNDRFVLMDGVVGLAFDERNGIVYFQPLATDRIFSVHKNVLRAGPLPSGQMLDIKLVGKKSSQGIGLAVGPFDNSLIFSPLSETAIASWNPATNQQSVLAYDRDRLQFIADMTTTRAEPGVIYAISSKFHRFFLKNLNSNELNNRILRLELPHSSNSLQAHPLPVPAHNSLHAYGITGLYSTQSAAHALQSYFTSPALQAGTTQPPYKYDHSGILNYSLRNPFTALNQGEAFPPSKATRDNYQRSYLDTLVGGSVPAPQPIAYTPQQRHSGYYYQRGAGANFHPQYKELINIYEWRNLEFAFPNERERTQALNSGRYNPDSPIPIDIDVYYPPKSTEPRLFITIPRFGQGVPYSLAQLTRVKRPNGTELQPFPSYDWHSSHGTNCDGLTSVYRVHIDPCGQMWILDSGEIEFEQHCAPQIVVLDLATNQLIHRYRLPSDDYKPKISRFVTPLVDITDPPPQGSCKEAIVYMSDPTGMGIVVYDVLAGKSWRIENKFTYPNPTFGTHTIAGESFELLDGTLGLAVTPQGIGLRRLLYFHSLSNELEVAIPLDVINNATNWGYGISSSLDEFIPLGRRNVQCAASAISKAGFWFCGFLEPIGIFGWNIRTPYTMDNVQLLAFNPETLQFVSGMKIIRRPGDMLEELWVLSNRLQKAFSGALNYKEINYRVQRCSVDDMLLGRGCRV